MTGFFKSSPKIKIDSQTRKYTIDNKLSWMKFAELSKYIHTEYSVTISKLLSNDKEKRLLISQKFKTESYHKVWENDIEKNLTKESYDLLSKFTDKSKPPLTKTVIVFNHNDFIKLELDCYHEDYNGISIVKTIEKSLHDQCLNSLNEWFTSVTEVTLNPKYSEYCISF